MRKVKVRMAGSETRRRRKEVTIRVTDEEHAEILSRADRASLSVAGYVRSTVLEKPAPRQSRRPSVNHKELAFILAQIGKLGSNVNQMARVANCGGWPGRHQINRAQDDIHAMRDRLMLALDVAPPKGPSDRS